MTKLIMALITFMSISHAYAKDVTITLNDDEQKALMTVLDQAVRQGGLTSVPQVWKFVQKLQSAVNPQGAVPSVPSVPPTPDEKK